MRKISTLAFMAFFCCMSAMAQIVLGDIKFSVKDGAKLNPTTGKIIVTFPNVTGVADPTAAKLFIVGNFGPENDFDAEGTLASGITIDFADDYGLEPSTDYTLTITSVKVDGAELAAEGGYKLNFKTRGSERKMSWKFAIDDASMALIVEDAAANTAGDAAKFIDITKNGNPRYYVPARDNEEILLPDGTVLPQTEDLLFKFGQKVFYVSGHSGGWADAICFNGQNQYMTIPDCQEGDVIIFNANRSTTGSASKQTCIQALNSAAIAPDGLEASTGAKDSIWLGSSFLNFKFEVQTPGDITFRFSNCILKSVDITEAKPKVPCKYRIVAANGEGDEQIILKEILGETEAISGSTVKAQFPYWVTDEDGNVYSHSAISKEFNVAFELNGDTTFVMNYNKTDFSGVAFLSEGEDLEGAALCTSPNAAIRSSMAKAAYFAEDVKLVTLQPGTYKVRAVLFDANKTPGYQCMLTKGEGESNEIVLTATATNFSEQESDLFEITEATDITLKASGNENQGVDVIMIYASTDAPEDPDGISEVKDAKKVVARKVAKDGRILIQTAAGIFNAVGVQVK